MSSRLPKVPVTKDEFRKTVVGYVLRGDYKSALKIAQVMIRRDPQDFDYRYQYAKLLGDHADELKGAARKRAKAEAVKILRPLTRALSGRSAEQRFGVCINYYYQFEDYRAMYRFGAQMAPHYEGGYFAQGLAASLIAQELHREGKLAQSRGWAERSLKAWGKYPLAGEDYYFAHYSHALALALLGHVREGRKSLEKAAKLSQRKITYWEFADVLALLDAPSIKEP